MSAWGGRRAVELRRILAEQLPCVCWRCGQLVTEGMAWDVGHVVEVDRHPDGMWDLELLRIEHSYCNRSAGAAYANRKRRRRPRRIPPTSRRW